PLRRPRRGWHPRRVAGRHEGLRDRGARSDRPRRATVDDRRGDDRRDGPGRPGAGMTSMKIEILPVHGIGDVSPGDDLPALIATAAPWLRDGDVLVVTSKIVSKAEGR